MPPRSTFLPGTLHRLLLLLCIAALPAARAQAQPVPFDVPDVPIVERTTPPDWAARWADDARFDYLQAPPPAGPSLLDRVKRWFVEHVLVPLFATPDRQRAFVWALVLLAAGLVVWAALRLLRLELSGPFRRAPRADVAHDADEVSRAMQGADVAAWLAEARARGDGRAVLRYAHLLALRELDARGLLAWHPDKTDRDFLREVEGTPHAEPFRRLTRDFEYAWYGDFPVAPAQVEGAYASLRALGIDAGRAEEAA